MVANTSCNNGYKNNIHTIDDTAMLFSLCYTWTVFVCLLFCIWLFKYKTQLGFWQNIRRQTSFSRLNTCIFLSVEQENGTMATKPVFVVDNGASMSKSRMNNNEDTRFVRYILYIIVIDLNKYVELFLIVSWNQNFILVVRSLRIKLTMNVRIRQVYTINYHFKKWTK